MHLGATAAAHPDRAAVIMGRGDTVAYRDLDRRSTQVAHLLRARGVGRGDTIAILVENQARFLEMTWAAQRSGLYFTAINTHLLPAEAAYIVADCGASVVISSAACAATAEALPAVARDVRTWLMADGAIDGWEPYETRVAEHGDEPLEGEVEGDFMLYSSGTTGLPKGIRRPLTFAPMGQGPTGAVMLLQFLGIGAGDVFLCPAPLYHTAPLAWSMACHRLGATVVVMERFDAEHALRLIEQHQVTHGLFVPTMFVRMLKLPEPVRDGFDLSSLRGVIHAAAPCPTDVKRAMIDWWGPKVNELYSSTEGAGITWITSEEWLTRPGSVGKPLLGTPHILDDTGAALPPGRTGTIWFEGAAPFAYHNDPARTADAFDDAGRATVGDVGHLDEDGYLYLTDRKAFMIISGGVNIYPQEAEDVLVMHPDVLDVAVIGVPDADLGEQVKAVVQPIAWPVTDPALEDTLLAYCRDRLSPYKCPRSVDFVAELPRTEAGKLVKRQLRSRYWPD